MSSTVASTGRRVSTRNYVRVSPRVFAVMWVGFLALHVLCLVYFAGAARFYWTTQKTYLATVLEFYKLGLQQKHYPVLAVTYGAIAAYHALHILYMIVWSAVKRRWCVSFLQEFAVRDVVTRFLSIERLRFQPDAQASKTTQAKRLLFQFFDSLFGRQGMFGVEGKHFDAVLIVREVIETSLQSNQAHNMSVHVPRPWLNRLYVTLIVVNCLLTAILHEVFGTNRLVRRTALLACDAVLDLFTSVILPSLLIATYLQDYNPALGGIPTAKWSDDLWFVNASNELELLLVSSWGELASTVLFSTAFMSCLENAKSLVRIRLARGIHDSSSLSIGPTESLQARGSVKSTSSLTGMTSLSSLIRIQPFKAQRCQRIANIMFGVWGLAVLAMHLHAESLPRLPQCAMQVRPWQVPRPACAMVLLDCHQDRIPGNHDQVASQWVALEHVYVVRMVIRHCSGLQMPPELTLFLSMTALKIYNTTVDLWPSDAALTNTDHPLLSTLMLVHVRLPNGELPLGLQSREFPKHLLGIQLCDSNLRTLPDDLDTKWPQNGLYLFEKSQFTEVPDVLRRLRPRQVSFAFNQLTRFPYEMAMWPSLLVLHVGGNPISTLMDTTSDIVPNITSLHVLVLTDTNVTLLPSWVDRVLLFRTIAARWGVFAARTPLCHNADRIQRGEIASFPGSELVAPASLSSAMVVTAPHTPALVSLAVCGPYSTIFYPLAVEDAINSIK